MSTVNIDPEKAGDAFYRYKMPKIQTKQESGGNGSKTVLVNIDAVAQRLARSSVTLVKYVEARLAAHHEMKDGRWILTGFHDQSKVQEYIFDYIKRFVLCKECRNPETLFVIGENKVDLDCKACSRVTPVDGKETLVNFILKENKKEKLKNQNAKGEKGKGTKGKAKSKDQQEEEAIDAATRKEREDDVILTESEEKRNPVEVLKEFFDENPQDEFPPKVFEMKQEYGLSEEDVVSLVFETLFDETVVEQLDSRAKLLKRFLPVGLEKDVIHNLMLLCAEKKIENKFGMALKKLYDLEVLAADVIVEWFEGKPFKRPKKAQQQVMKEKAKPVIEWIQMESEDEEEGEDEEEEEED